MTGHKFTSERSKELWADPVWRAAQVAKYQGAHKTGSIKPERDRAICDAYLSGMTVARVGRSFGITGARVAQILSRAGVAIRKRAPLPPKMELRDTEMVREILAATDGVLRFTNNGIAFLISPEDAEFVDKYIWRAVHSLSGRVYIYRSSRSGGPTCRLALHRELMNAEKGQLVDHINRNTFDNRRSNLRFATKSQNIANAARKPGKSGYLGVRKVGDKYTVTICNKYYGGFLSAEAAAQKRDEIAKSLWGAFAYLNFPEAA